jgi:hypothetical protein
MGSVMDPLAAALIAVQENIAILKGPKGDKGADGKDGRNGHDGKDGRDGEDGAPGKDGKDGAIGPQGDRGPQGPPGPGGRNIALAGGFRGGAGSGGGGAPSGPAGGDLEGTYPNPTVADDSHSHTSATVTTPTLAEVLVAGNDPDGTIIEAAAYDPGGASEAEGGQLEIEAGSLGDDPEGGSVIARGGDVVTSGALGGRVLLYGGDGVDSPGSVVALGGAASSGAGGQVSVSGGQGTTDGGPAIFQGGDNSQGGGGAKITAYGSTGTGGAARSGYLQVHVGNPAATTYADYYVMGGTADPSAGAGVAAAIGSQYTQIIGGTTAVLWVKTAAADTAWTTSQPLDSDLTSIAALATTSFGRGLLTSADAAALRSSASLGTLATQSGTFSGTSSGTNTGDQTSIAGLSGEASAAQKVKDHTHAATGTGADGGGAAIDLNAGTLRLPVGTGALTTTEGHIGYQSTNETVRVYDGQRERGVSSVGWTPYAYPVASNPASAWTSAVTVATGVVLAIPMHVTGHMLLRSVSMRELSTTLARSWSWALYVQDLNNGNGAENSLRQVATSAAADTWTASAASTRTSAATSAPVYLVPGIYWLAIRSDQGTQNISVGTVATNTLALNMAQTKTTTLSSPLDFVAATWTKTTGGCFGARLNGDVFGQTAAF